VIPVAVACTSDTYRATVNVFVEHAVTPREFVGGTGYQDVTTCDRRRIVQVLVKASTTKRFSEGTARSEADLYACDNFGNCNTLQNSKGIQLVK
jgi:hypothetical protein